MNRIGIGLYGANGHQIGDLPADHRDGEVVAVAGIEDAALASHWRGVARHATLDALIADDRVQLVSLCSPRRADQAGDAIRCLAAGKHVYAEKPCALSESELDRVLAAAARARRRFHEMAGTAVAEPWWSMRRLVADGAIGTPIQVWAQKSYPLHDRRPQDEAVDGGLLAQAGVHAVRLIEQVGGVAIAEVDARETQLGNPGTGDLRTAVALTMTLANGGLAQATINYCQPRAFPAWGNVQLRVAGSAGMIEAVDDGERRRLVTHQRDHGAFAIGGARPEYHDLVLASLARGEAMPWSSEAELHPTRIVLRARASRRLVRAGAP
ncbi:MAG TPA: Gfo/Idh/MocA family oxidoreductase [Planctomycetota bacterium]|nr:Gfo/Idh/MocA family oxidoreductase [Planctomycetota bacterium]